jgi:hypothetical protein
MVNSWPKQRRGFLKKYDDILTWDGYGGKFNLASGRCRLRLFDLSADASDGGVSLLKPIIAVVSDLPGDRAPSMGTVSVRACISHVATTIVHRFKLDRSRMLLVEYYPKETYGRQSEKVIPEKYDVVDLTWHGDKALFPNWRPLKPPLLDTVRGLIASNP